MPQRDRPPVVIIHGYLATAATNLPIAARLKRDGIRSYNVPIPGLNTQDIRVSSAQVAHTVERVRRDTGAERVDMIGVSMGGVIGLHYVRRGPSVGRVRRLVTLASPLKGTPLARLGHAMSGFSAYAARQLHPHSEFIRELHDGRHDDCEVISVTAPGDPIVTERDAAVPGVRHVRAPFGQWPLGHYWVLLHPGNYQFLRDLLD